MANSELSREELKRRFAEIKPALSRDEARAQASRCIFCYDAPCARACPTRIDVPRFIRQILHDNPAGAAETILDENILGGSCARVCPTEVLCEGACVDRTLQGAPVPIGLLQRYAVDWADEHGVIPFAAEPAREGRVAILGTGPAGLSCAFELRRRGFEVILFEAASLAGGLNRVGIAPYKIGGDYAWREVERVRELGVEIRLDSPVDGEGVKQLLADFDAVFLGIGLGKTAGLGIPGEDGEGVWEALDFIRQLHTRELDQCDVGRHMIVIGGGNTAIDVSTEARRLGAESVTVVYRRRAEDMPAYAHEYELALADGVRFEWLSAPVEFLHEGGRLVAVLCRRLDAQGEGRAARLVPVAGSEYSLPCDMAVKALGQLPRPDLSRALAGLVLHQGRIQVDPATGATGVPGLYAGGDCVNGGMEVVHAVQAGKLAARAMAKALQA